MSQFGARLRRHAVCGRARRSDPSAGSQADADLEEHDARRGGDGTAGERTAVAAQRRHASEDQRAHALREIEEAAERPDDRAALVVRHGGEREQHEGGIQQRHPGREDGRAGDEPGHAPPARHDREPRCAARQRDGRRDAPAEDVGQARPEDAHAQDQPAIQQEQPVGATETELPHVEGGERGEPGEADEAEEEDGARSECGAVQQLALLCGRDPPGGFDGDRAEHGREQRQRRRHRPRGDEPVVPEDGLTEGGTEREAAVHRDRPVADRFAPSMLGREVGDHRGSTDEERSFPDAAEEPDQHQVRQCVHGAVERRRDGNDERAADDEDPPPEPITDASRVGPEEDRTDEQRAHRHAHAHVAAGERALHVLGDDRDQHPDGHEVAEAGRDDEQKARRQQAFTGGHGGHRRRARSNGANGYPPAACARASSHEARSAIIRRYCITIRGLVKPSAPTSRPPRPNSATNRSSSSEPSASATSSSPRMEPTTWIFTSYWSDHTNGTGANASASLAWSASSRRAAATPCSVAFVQCSTRMLSPSNNRLGHRATPAATIPGAARHVASHTTPSSTATPLPSSQAVSGATPTPTTTTSASIVRPSASRTRSTRSRPSNPATVTPQRRSTPCSRCNRPQASPTIGPTARTSGVGSISSTVTSRPRPRHVAATSEPMNPAPITTMRGRVSRRARMARQSSMVRSTKMPSSAGVSGNVRGCAPVAMTSPSNGSVSPPSTSM